MTTALGASAREALAQLIEADAANGEGYFLIASPNGACPLVTQGQFRPRSAAGPSDHRVAESPSCGRQGGYGPPAGCT